MTVNKFLQFVDTLVFTETNEHLTDIQKKIVQGLLNDQSYREIANNNDYDEGYIGDLSRKLYKILSKHLKEDINKHNFSWTIERIVNSQLINIGNGSINYCQNNHKNVWQDQEEFITNYSYHNLKFAPKIYKFHDRPSELEKLSKYICHDHIPLVGVLGFTGIGKSYLVRKFIDLNLEKFEIIIWQNLKVSHGLDEVVSIKNYDLSKQSEVCKFFDILREKKCLIILDSFEQLFVKGEFAGKFKPEFYEYQKFLKMLLEIEHQSSIILISQEKCPEIKQDNLSPVKCLNLSGFNTTEIITDYGLKDEDCWLNLVKLYEGNPVFLKEICLLIKDFYDGQVREFLAENTLHFTPNMLETINSLLERLSPQEKEIIDTLIKLNKPVTKEELKEYINLTSVDLINSLNSLKSRFLLKQIKNNYCLYSLIKQEF
jgi:hypothetical protein